ncbi:MAG: NAD(P)/FAD-dependent oxidoreductase [Desulfococcaceae bacterium]
MDLLIDDIVLAPDEPEALLAERLALRLGKIRIDDWQVWRRSLDARKKDRIVFRYKIRVSVNDTEAPTLLARPSVSRFPEPPAPPPAGTARGKRVVVVGAGPAGLFCALRLLDAGAGVAILERGRSVNRRMRDIRRLETEGVLDPESNVLFGEGGAGTYSDGKLTTRTRRPEIAWFFRRLADFGAPDRLLAEARPHIGTDRLRLILIRIRETLRDRGAEIQFGRRVRDLRVENGRVVGVTTDAAEDFRADAVVLAAGHSARDLYETLRDRGVALAPKGFAAGVRVEHPADLIREVQYGRSRHRDILPPAEYQLTWNDPQTKRGIYSFCMCPGGRVLNSASENGGLCVNGMSYSTRGLPRSNAALVVAVNPADFASDASAPPDPLAGIAFQRKIERAAFAAGGGAFHAPAQRVTDFLADRESSTLPETSYRPGVRPGRVGDFLPPWIVEGLRRALPQFDRRMRGFVSSEAVLVGAETRTSSPVRIVRGEDLASVSHPGLYPAGEGAGYAGGIVSSAVDGIRVADRIAGRGVARD